jgi:peptidoglycan/LPS O-acetylase OafA/YrhL
MRFIAAVLVFFHHVIWLSVFANPGTAQVYRTYLINAGHVGVSFFFVLSGFILTVSARETDTLPRFYRRRFVKIYPNYLVTFGLALVVIAGATTHGVLPNLFLMQAWQPNYDIVFSVDPPGWSLSCELLFYLSFPFLLRLIRKIDVNRLWYWVAGVLLAIVAIAVVSGTLLPKGPFLPDGQPISMVQFWFVYVLPPVRTLDFVLGMLIGTLVLNGKWVGPRLGTAAVLFVVFYLVSTRLPYVFGLDAATIIPIALLVPAGALADVNGQRSVLRSRFAVFLGEISFAFYLIHVIIMLGLRPMFGATALFSAPVAFLIVLFTLVVAVLAAWLLYALVEKPIMKRFSSPRRPPPAPILVAPTSEPVLQGES